MTAPIRARAAAAVLALAVVLSVPGAAQAAERRGPWLYEGGVAIGYLSGDFLYINGTAVGRVRAGVLYTMDGRYLAPLPVDPNEATGQASPRAPASPACGWYRESAFSLVYLCQ